MITMSLLLENQQFLDATANLVTTLGFIVTIGGLFFALRTYMLERKKERLEKTYATFDDLDNKYVEFMYKCTEYPHLDFFSIPAQQGRIISEQDMMVERAMFAVLISIFERAFLLFERHPDRQTKDRQYAGWVECMKTYCTRESYLREWNAIGDQFDSHFQREMNAIIKAMQDGNPPAG
jgi:hypothetical protein